MPKSEYGFEVVPKELESSNPSSKKDGSTFFTGEQLIESGFTQNFFKTDDKRKTAPVAPVVVDAPVAPVVVDAPVAPVIETAPVADEAMSKKVDNVFAEKNPDKVEILSGNLARNKSTEFELSSIGQSIVDKATKAAAAIQRVAPNVRVVLHDTTKEYTDFGKEGSRGMYDIGSKTIHIDLSKANKNTIGHETFHSILFNTIGTEKDIQAATDDMYKSVKRSLATSPLMKRKLRKFSENYGENIQSEEALAELFGMLSSDYKKLSAPVKVKIKQFINKIASKFGLTDIINLSEQDLSDLETIELLNTMAARVKEGEAITEEDVEPLTETQEQGEGGEVGTIRVPRNQIEVIDSPNVKDDTRPWVRNVLEMLDLVDIEGTKFITNMYDYTNAGTTDLGNGYSIELLGGRNYVALIMERMGRKIGDISNLAAFNNKTQAETFIRNSIEGEANMFAPHSGTLDGSWQFQQHIFEELVNLVLDKNILTNEDIIKSFNAGLVRTPKALKTVLAQYKKDLKSFNNKGFYKDGKEKIEEKPIKPTKIIEPFEKFLKRYNEDKSLPELKNKENLNDFIKNPKELVRLLDIENNFSPDLRKRLNQKIASNKKFQKAIGVNNLEEFHQRIIDPLNKGVVGGEIMTLVKFDPSTFEIIKTKPGALDHHPSFGWAVKAKIENIYQPTKFFKSYDITEEYTKFNIDGPSVSRKADVGEAKFKQSNVSSSAGAIPKKATISRAVREQKLDI